MRILITCWVFCSSHPVTVDCWSGKDGEPVVYHGHTLTSKILFKDIMQVVNLYAFEASQ